MPKRAPKPTAVVSPSTPAAPPVPVPVGADAQLDELADLLKHIEGAPRAHVAGLVADGLKRIEAIRNSLD